MSANAPCVATLIAHSKVDHGVLREQMADGRCPICDPSVSRSEYGDIVRRVAVNPELRQRLFK